MDVAGTRIGTIDMTAAVSRRHPNAGKTLAELYEVNLNHLREHGAQLLAFAAQRRRPHASRD